MALMNSILLNEYLRKLTENEEKQLQYKNLMNSLRLQFEGNNGKLSQLKSTIKTLRNKFQTIPQILFYETDLIEVEAQNKSISEQLSDLTTKISDSKQKFTQSREERKQIIKEFEEKSFNFGQTYCFGAEIQVKSQECREKALKLKVEEKQLNEDLVKIRAKDSEDIISEKDSLTDAINALKERIPNAKKYNSEIRLIVRQHSDRLNELNTSDCTEVIDLQRQLDDIEKAIEEIKMSFVKREKQRSLFENSQVNLTEVYFEKPVESVSCEQTEQSADEWRSDATTEPDCKTLWEKKRQRKRRRVTFQSLPNDTIDID